MHRSMGRPVGEHASAGAGGRRACQRPKSGSAAAYAHVRPQSFSCTYVPSVLSAYICISGRTVSFHEKSRPGYCGTSSVSPGALR